MIRLELRKGASPTQPYYCRAVSIGNGAVLMTSEMYRDKQSARHVAELMKGGAGGASIVDLT